MYKEKILQLHHLSLAVVLNYDALGFGIIALDMVGTHGNNDERAFLEHAGELAFTIGDGKLLLCIVVAEVNVGKASSLVAIVGAFVLVEGEVAILSLIT